MQNGESFTFTDLVLLLDFIVAGDPKIGTQFPRTERTGRFQALTFPAEFHRPPRRSWEPDALCNHNLDGMYYSITDFI
jgi:hypothetical protein